MRYVVGLALVLAGSALARSAGAVEREHALGVDVGPAVLVISDKSTPDVGGTVGLHYSYGLTDAFNFVANAGWSLVALGETAQDSSTPRTRPASLENVNAGVAYVLDVLQWVPWISAELGGYALQGGTVDGVKLEAGAAIGLGLDYRLARSWSLGVAVHQHFMLDMSTYPSFTQALVRFEYVWGW
jgi:hypothetical protein